MNAKMNRRQFLVGSAAVAAAPALVGAADAAGAGGIPFVTLNNGVKMPALGFGTLHLGDAKATQRAVEQALEVGFRLFDTAQSYANEEAIGAALWRS